jgi:hypothetical protein
VLETDSGNGAVIGEDRLKGMTIEKVGKGRE